MRFSEVLMIQGQILHPEQRFLWIVKVSFSPKSLMMLGWSNSFMQAASRRKSSISVRVQMATENKME